MKTKYSLWSDQMCVMRFAKLIPAKETTERLGMYNDADSFDLIDDETGEVLESWRNGERTYIAM